MNKVRNWFLKGLGALMGLLVLFHLVEDWRGHRAWSRVLEARRRAGLPSSPAGFAPPPVPDEENFAAAPFIDDVIKGKGKGWNINFPPVGPAWYPLMAGNWRIGQMADMKASREALKTDMETALAPYGPVFDALAEASRRSKCRFLVDYEKEECSIPLLLGFRAADRTLASRALLRLEEGRNEAAFEDVETVLRIAHHLGQEPQLSTQLLRMASLNIIFQPLWEGVQGHRWGETQLAALQGQLETMEVLGPWRRCLQFEQVCRERFSGMSWWTAFKEGYHWSYPMSPIGRTKVLLRTLVIPQGWQRQNQAWSDAYWTRSMISPLDPEHHRVYAALAREAAVFPAKATPYTFVSFNAFPALQSQVSKFARLQVGIDEARVACALERFRLTRKAYPESLQALVGATLDALPQDLMAGTPLHYQRTAEGGYRLWSLGWTGQDLGGAPGPDPKDITQGNWCWTVAR